MADDHPGPTAPLWDPRKRTWHDIVADSLVVKASFYPPGEFGRLPR